MVHRGPDDEGIYVEGRVGLGMRRLSIIDLATGHQPISNEDGTIWIVFNGEIYNHAALRERLIASGHRFRTQCDTETIVHLYEQYGHECLRHLRGMFAFAIWDSRTRRLFAARDRMGIKPLYYRHTAELFLFGSEIRSSYLTLKSGRCSIAVRFPSIWPLDISPDREPFMKEFIS